VSSAAGVSSIGTAIGKNGRYPSFFALPRSHHGRPGARGIPCVNRRIGSRRRLRPGGGTFLLSNVPERRHCYLSRQRHGEHKAAL